MHAHKNTDSFLTILFSLRWVSWTKWITINNKYHKIFRIQDMDLKCEVMAH